MTPGPMRVPMAGTLPFTAVDVSPSDAVVALRSFPRRYAEVLARPDDDDLPDDPAKRRPTPDQWSANPARAPGGTGPPPLICRRRALPSDRHRAAIRPPHTDARPARCRLPSTARPPTTHEHRATTWRPSATTSRTPRPTASARR